MSEGLLYYLAYGSNLHPVRLRERVPSAELLDVVELRHYRLAFQKRGQDGSSKCNLARTGEESDEVYGLRVWGQICFRRISASTCPTCFLKPLPADCFPIPAYETLNNRLDPLLTLSDCFPIPAYETLNNRLDPLLTL